MLLCAAIVVQAQSWTAPDNNAYEDETVVYARLTTNLGTAADFVIGAFIDDVCRASAGPSTANGQTYFTLRIKGSSADNGKDISFKACDTTTGLEYDLTPTLAYTGESYQYPSEAVELTLNAATAITIGMVIGRSTEECSIHCPANAGARS